MLTSFERLTAEIQVRGGRLRETINDPEPLFHMRNVSAEPLLPGAVPLSGVPEGLFNKNLIGGIRSVEPEPPPADQVAEMMRRYVMFQAASFMVTGATTPYTVETTLIQVGQSHRRPWNFYYWPTKADAIHEPWAGGNSWVHTRHANQQPRQDTPETAATKGQTAPNYNATGINGRCGPWGLGLSALDDHSACD